MESQAQGLLGLRARLARWLDAPIYLGEDPRQVTEDETESWMEAAATAQPPRMNRDWIVKQLRRKNITRMHRLKKDFAWMQRQMPKFGLNPDDARWLL